LTTPRIIPNVRLQIRPYFLVHCCEKSLNLSTFRFNAYDVAQLIQDHNKHSGTPECALWPN